jgi:hypothetical protein
MANKLVATLERKGNETIITATDYGCANVQATFYDVVNAQKDGTATIPPLDIIGVMKSGKEFCKILNHLLLSSQNCYETWELTIKYNGKEQRIDLEDDYSDKVNVDFCGVSDADCLQYEYMFYEYCCNTDIAKEIIADIEAVRAQYNTNHNYGKIYY